METLYQVLGLVAAGFVVWILYRSIKNQPQQFSREKIMKSFSSMGILALILIVFVTALVYLAK